LFKREDRGGLSLAADIWPEEQRVVEEDNFILTRPFMMDQREKVVQALKLN
jgi:hypothetical protein